MILKMAATLALFFASCGREQCWQCATETTTTRPSGQTVAATSTVVCDQTRRDIQDYEKLNSGTYKNGTTTVTKTTNCH